MISYVRANDQTGEVHIEGFVEVYKEAFAGPPYFEAYTTEEVMDEVWTPHVNDGISIIALDGLKVVGLGCALPVEKAPDDVQQFIQERRKENVLPVDGDKTWYMSELGVLESHRGHGIGTALVRKRLETICEVGDSHFVFRTAAEGSNSIRIYQRAGAVALTTKQDLSDSEQVTINGSQSTDRVYLYGDCESAIIHLRAA